MKIPKVKMADPSPNKGSKMSPGQPRKVTTALSPGYMEKAGVANSKAKQTYMSTGKSGGTGGVGIGGQYKK
jgi:hypothetical protein